MDGDEELFEFLRTTRFDLDGRVKFVQQALSECKARVGDGKVVCPKCGRGAVAMEVEALG